MGADPVIDKIFENIALLEPQLMNLEFRPLSSLGAFLVRYSCVSGDRELGFVSVIIDNFSRRFPGRDEMKDLDFASVQEEWKKSVPGVIGTLLVIKESYDSNDIDLQIESMKKLMSYASKFKVYRVFGAERAKPVTGHEIQAMREDIERLKAGMMALVEAVRKSTSQENSNDEEPGGE
jgi:hypothetical protein